MPNSLRQVATLLVVRRDARHAVALERFREAIDVVPAPVKRPATGAAPWSGPIVGEPVLGM